MEEKGFFQIALVGLVREFCHKTCRAMSFWEWKTALKVFEDKAHLVGVNFAANL